MVVLLSFDDYLHEMGEVEVGAVHLLQSDPSIGVRVVEKGVGRDDQNVAMVEQGYQVETELF